MRVERLVEAIQVKRDQMIKVGLHKGLRDEETIKCSQELDELLNQYWQVTYCTNGRLVRN